MKNIIKKILFNLLIFSLACCNQTENAQSTIKLRHTIPINSDSFVSMDNVFNSFKLIPLETKDGSYIQEISKLYTYKDTIIISDFKLSTIFLFDSKGKFLKSLKNLGRGPKEYVSLSDVSFDTHKKQLNIMDIGGRKLLKYDLNLNFISYKPISADKLGYEFEVVGKDYLFYREFKKFPEQGLYNAVLNDTATQNILSAASLIPKSLDEARSRSTKPMDVENEIGYIVPLHSDTLFEVKSSQIRPFCRIVIPQKFDIKATESWKEGKKFSESNLITEIFDGKKVYGFDNLIVNKDFIFFKYLLAHKNYMVVYNKKQNETRIVQRPSILHNQLIVEAIGKMNDNIIFKIQSDNITGAINKDSKLNLTEGHNPVLVLAQIRR